MPAIDQIMQQTAPINQDPVGQAQKGLDAGLLYAANKVKFNELELGLKAKTEDYEIKKGQYIVDALQKVSNTDSPIQKKLLLENIKKVSPVNPEMEEYILKDKQVNAQLAKLISMYPKAGSDQTQMMNFTQQMAQILDSDFMTAGTEFSKMMAKYQDDDYKKMMMAMRGQDKEFDQTLKLQGNAQAIEKEFAPSIKASGQIKTLLEAAKKSKGGLQVTGAITGPLQILREGKPSVIRDTDIKMTSSGSVPKRLFSLMEDLTSMKGASLNAEEIAGLEKIVSAYESAYITDYQQRLSPVEKAAEQFGVKKESVFTPQGNKALKGEQKKQVTPDQIKGAASRMSFEEANKNLTAKGYAPVTKAQWSAAGGK